MNILLLIPSVLKAGLDDQIEQRNHPRMDYNALADGLRRNGSHNAVLTGYAEANADNRFLVRAARKLGGLDAALAVVGYLDGKKYDAIFTNGENIAIPLALLLKFCKSRPRHVTIGHRLSAGKKRLFFTFAKAYKQIDLIFVYATTQLQFAVDQLGIPATQVRLIAFHADDIFFAPQDAGNLSAKISSNEREPAQQICSAGLEWRDYPTLIEAVSGLPALQVRLAAASPWSKHANETENRELPKNVDAKKYDYKGLRDLYEESDFVVVPLYENDFQAGVTTLLEGMAMGKAVVVTRTTGQTDVVSHGANGLEVKPGDADGWKSAIAQLSDDAVLRNKLGRAARQWVEQNATLDHWVAQITNGVCG